MLTDNLREISSEFGAVLGASAAVESYRKAQEVLGMDPETRRLDETFQRTYDQLQTKQRSGETLEQEQIDAFYALRARTQQEPLIVERDQALSEVKNHFLNAALILNDKLGLDFPALARRV